MGREEEDPLVWDQGSKKKQRRTDIRVNVDLASLPGPLGFLSGPWVQVHGGCITGSDVAAWPCSVSAFCANSLLFGVLCIGLQVMRIWGHFGVSFLEVLILFGQWAGHRLLSEKVTRHHVRANRPIFYFLCACFRGNRNKAGLSIHYQLGSGFGQAGGIGRFLPCRVEGSYVSVTAPWLGTVFAWSYVTTLESCHHQRVQAVNVEF